MNIKDDNISVVVQGPFSQDSTILCIKSLRNVFPKCEIILSTWEGTDISAVKDLCDHVVFSKDPGAPLCRGFYRDNLNRQLVSTQAGLKKVSRPYCMKFRSDLVLVSDDFLTYMNKFPMRNEDFLFFKERVLVTSFFSKKYMGIDHILPVPFHISDWISFGLTEDIKLLWDIPLYSEREGSYYFLNNATSSYMAKDLYGQTHRFPPEAYIFIEALKKVYPYRKFPDNYLDFNDDTILFYEQIVSNNMVILDPWQIVFYSSKTTPISYKKLSTNRYFFITQHPKIQHLYDYYQFRLDYKRYCDPNYKLSFTDRVWEKLTHRGRVKW